MDQLIEEIIAPYQSQLEKVFLPYKNHVLRVAHFAMLLKKDYQQDDPHKIAIAAVFHDIGIWTANTFDYLDPSRSLARQYLAENGLEKWADEIDLIIDNHHKLGRYRLPSGKEQRNSAFLPEEVEEKSDKTKVGQSPETLQDNVEAFRKADLLDLTKGLKSFGIKRKEIRAQYEKYPMNGFRTVIIQRFFKHFIRHPFRPLPMMKR